MIDYNEIENSVIATLSGVVGVNTLSVYSGQLQDEFKTVAARFPAVYVLCSGSSWTPKNQREQVAVKVEIYCCARDIRMTEARIGAQDLCLEIRKLLNRKRVSGAEFILNNEKLVFWHPESRIAVMGAFYNFNTGTVRY